MNLVPKVNSFCMETCDVGLVRLGLGVLSNLTVCNAMIRNKILCSEIVDWILINIRNCEIPVLREYTSLLQI